MPSHGATSKVLKTNSAIVCRAVKSMLTGACSVLDSRGRVRYGDKCVATKRTRDVICSKLKSQAVMRHSGVLVHASAFSGSAENLRSSQILFTSSGDEQVTSRGNRESVQRGRGVGGGGGGLRSSQLADSPPQKNIALCSYKRNSTAQERQAAWTAFNLPAAQQPNSMQKQGFYAAFSKYLWQHRVSVFCESAFVSAEQ